MADQSYQKTRLMLTRALRAPIEAVDADDFKMRADAMTVNETLLASRPATPEKMASYAQAAVDAKKSSDDAFNDFEAKFNDLLNQFAPLDDKNQPADYAQYHEDLTKALEDAAALRDTYDDVISAQKDPLTEIAIHIAAGDEILDYYEKRLIPELKSKNPADPRINAIKQTYNALADRLDALTATYFTGNTVTQRLIVMKAALDQRLEKADEALESSNTMAAIQAAQQRFAQQEADEKAEEEKLKAEAAKIPPPPPAPALPPLQDRIAEYVSKIMENPDSIEIAASYGEEALVRLEESSTLAIRAYHRAMRTAQMPLSETFSSVARRFKLDQVFADVSRHKQENAAAYADLVGYITAAPEIVKIYNEQIIPAAAQREEDYFADDVVAAAASFSQRVCTTLTNRATDALNNHNQLTNMMMALEENYNLKSIEQMVNDTLKPKI